MPFGPYKSHTDCVRKNPKMKNPHAFCAWLEKKITGNDPLVMFYLTNEAALQRLYLSEMQKLELSPLTREHANSLLKSPQSIRKDPDAVVIDDHRWVHMWANTIRDDKELFISKEQLRRLHQIYVDEFMRRGFNHQSPLKFEPLQLMGKNLETVLAKREKFLVDPNFISYVGSSVSGKQDPRDVDVLFHTAKTPGYRDQYLQSMPPELREEQNFIWEPGGPSGPHIEGFELWAIPKEDISVKEPKYNIQPMSPFPPARPKRAIDKDGLYELLEDNYFVIRASGIRLMIHRKGAEIIAYDKDLDEFELPDSIYEGLLALEDPPTFILDGFLSKEEGQAVFLMVDMPWWRDSEHIGQPAEIRQHFLNKLTEGKIIKSADMIYFSNRKDVIDYLKEESGPLFLVPGTSSYPLDGESDWLLYEDKELDLAAEGSDAKIRELVNSGKWENMSADARFNLMTKRRYVEPLYPFAQLKTTKKGYSAREVFGLKSVDELAEDLFKVPNKQATEVKFDGFRIQVHKKDDRVRLFTESGHEITKQLPGIVADVKRLPGKSFSMDAEATPYDESLTNLGRAAAAPAFAKGAKGPVDDKLWAIHVFDLLYLDGEDIHDLPYAERRNRLRGIELPTRDIPKSKSDFREQLWENNVYWATSASAMVKLAEQVSQVKGSEGAMFKQADSKYRLSGNTPLWSKMKVSYEIDALVVGINQEGGSFNYVGAIGPISGVDADVTAPVDSPKGKKFVKWKGKIYSILGKTFNTKQKAQIGDIIRVTVKDVRKIDERVYHWFHPQVLEIREDKTKPDPLKTAETISETAKGKQAAAYLISGRFGEESPLACCLSPWIAVSGEEWTYLQHDDEAYETLKEMGISVFVGTSVQRDLMKKWMEAGFDFELTEAETILDHRGRPLMLDEPGLLDTVSVDPVELNNFYSSIRSGDLCMKTSCGACVPLKKIEKLADVYVTYPDESKTWKYVVQFHIRGLSVHADFRAEISRTQLLGWTWDLGKSLIKPLLSQIRPEDLAKVGLTREQLKDMTISEVSAKLKSTEEGRALRKHLSQKTQELSMKQLTVLCNQLWAEEVEPLLADPNRKILTQRKAPEPHDWLTYEGEIPAGAVGATRELEGQFVIMDQGTVEFGAQKGWFHEYWLHGKRIKDRRFIVRRLATRKKWKVREAFAWMTFFTKKGARPYTISNRAVSQKWMPPKGISALPKSVRAQIPGRFQYWRAKNNQEIRNVLVKAIRNRKVIIKLAAGLRFTVKRVWHKGPEVRRGMPVVRYWILLHDGKKVYTAWDFGQDNDPLEGEGTARKREGKGFQDLLGESGEIPATHPASYTKKLPNQFDTSDKGAVKIIGDTKNMLRLKFNGKQLKGLYVFVKQDPGSEMWVFTKSELPEPKKAMLMAGLEDGKILHLAPADMKTQTVGNLLFISGPAIKPGEVVPSGGTPAFFTKGGIAKMWASMERQPIVVLHGELKGDVIGFVDKIHYDEATGWGWIDRGVIWHPQGIKLILDGTLPAFSIEVLPESIWDPEHQHEHVVGGHCVGLAVVPVGACKTCNISDSYFGSLKASPGQVFKYGMTPEQYIRHLYWEGGMSTPDVSVKTGIPRATVESWMKAAGIPRRTLLEARRLRSMREGQVRKFGGRASITALGTGAFTDICEKGREESPQCKEYQAGGKSKRNYTATLFSVGTEHLLINTPKGISGMLGIAKVKPRYVLLEHIHEDVIGGLHELRPLKPNVFATKETWAYLKKHYRALSGQKGTFDEIYNFPRYVIGNQKFSIGKTPQFLVLPVKVKHAKPGDPTALGFRINIGDQIIWHCSDIRSIPNRKKVLEGVDVYIGDGASLKRGVKTGASTGHASMQEQINWAKEANINRIFFTQIGHVGMTHDDLNKTLKEAAPNAMALFDGSQISLGGKTLSANLPTKTAQRLAAGQKVIIVREKPYSEFAKHTIYFGDDKFLYGLYVEGFPEGPYSAAKVREEYAEEHGLSDEEWKDAFKGAETVWLYRPKAINLYDEPKDYSSEQEIGPYFFNINVEITDALV